MRDHWPPTGLQQSLGVVTIPLSGMSVAFYGAFGYPESPALQYYVNQDLAVNRPGEDVSVEPCVRILYDDEAFSSERLEALYNERAIISERAVRSPLLN
ncbi:MAG: hypothetical protein ACLFPO_10965 [Spirochaetaceae bacterium]